MAEHRTPTILVVDDEKMVRDITQAFLALNGYEVRTASDGREAFDMLLNNHYDVVITDLHMPLMGGIELLEKISQLKADTVTIVLTGRAGTAADCRPEPYARLCKPFSHNKLIEVVQEGLKSRVARASS
jgi:DNA-binding NtrC family response regulator